MAELLGTHNYQLDPKGRISLPGRFREALADGAYLTLGQDGCLFCFPRAEWRTGVTRSAPPPSPIRKGARTRACSSATRNPSILDSQGRLVVPQRLRQQVAIGKEVVVVGVQDRMEIWDREAHERYLDAFGGAYQAGTLYPRRPG